MKTRLANKKDLPKLKSMYSQIVKAMNINGIYIWNEYYPFEEFEGDIEKQRLYLIVDKSNIIAAFTVFDKMEGSNCFKWEDINAKAMYVGRIGVNVNYLRKGFGSEILAKAYGIAKEKNCKYLRLTVVEDNLPAIKLYLNNGYMQVCGIYKEFSESLNKTINEIGFELKLNNYSKRD